MIAVDLDYLADVQDRKREPERRLWVGVLLTVCRDAQGINCYYDREIDLARRWLLTPHNPDRESVCEMAGVPERSLLTWANRTLPFVDAETMTNDSYRSGDWTPCHEDRTHV